jgi:hypothetical protein
LRRSRKYVCQFLVDIETSRTEEASRETNHPKCRAKIWLVLLHVTSPEEMLFKPSTGEVLRVLPTANPSS